MCVMYALLSFLALCESQSFLLTFITLCVLIVFRFFSLQILKIHAALMLIVVSSLRVYIKDTLYTTCGLAVTLYIVARELNLAWSACIGRSIR